MPDAPEHSASGTVQACTEKTTKGGKTYAYVTIDGINYSFFDKARHQIPEPGTKVNFTYRTREWQGNEYYNGVKICEPSRAQDPDGSRGNTVPVPSREIPARRPDSGPTKTYDAVPSLDAQTRFITAVVIQAMQNDKGFTREHLIHWTGAAREAIRKPFLPIMVQQKEAVQKAQNLGSPEDDIEW